MRNLFTLPPSRLPLIIGAATALSAVASAQIMDDTPAIDETLTQLEQFNAADISGDGYLDGEEFAAFQASMDKSGDDAAFAKHDANADGLIAYEEVLDAHDDMDAESKTEDWEMPAKTDMNDMPDGEVEP